MSKVKNLSITQVKKEDAKRYKDKVRVTFDNGVKVDVDTKFRPTKIDMAAQELIQLMFTQFKQEGNVLNEGSLEILNALMLKHFTSIEFPEELTLVTLVESLKFLIDNHYYIKIMEHVNKDEVKTYFETMTHKLQRVGEILQSEEYKEIDNVDKLISEVETEKGDENSIIQ